MRYVVWGLLAVLVVLHQSGPAALWAKPAERVELVFGFLPAELLFHAGISLAAAATWFLAVRFAWPVEDETAGGQKPGFSEKPGDLPDRDDPPAGGGER